MVAPFRDPSGGVRGAANAFVFVREAARTRYGSGSARAPGDRGRRFRQDFRYVNRLEESVSAMVSVCLVKSTCLSSIFRNLLFHCAANDSLHYSDLVGILTLIQPRKELRRVAHTKFAALREVASVRTGFTG